MNEAEFEILDELYFVTPYHELEESIQISEVDIRKTLISMTEKGWVSVYENSDIELDHFDLMANFKSYYYLATKKGLLAHNRQ